MSSPTSLAPSASQQMHPQLPAAGCEWRPEPGGASRNARMLAACLVACQDCELVGSAAQLVSPNRQLDPADKLAGKVVIYSESDLTIWLVGTCLCPLVFGPMAQVCHIKANPRFTCLSITGFRVLEPRGSGKACSDICPIPSYTRIIRRSCRHRCSCREGGDPVRYGLL